MWRPEYYVRLIPLPKSVEGVSLPNSDGSFDVYINSSLSRARRERALQHELNHITDDHFYLDRLPLGEVESAARTGRLVGLPVDRGASGAGAAPSPSRRLIREFVSLEALLAFALKNGGI